MAELATSFVYFCSGRVLLVSNNVENSKHTHYAMQITLSLDSQPFRLIYPEGEVVSKGVVVLPNCPHQTIGPGAWRALLLIDPQTPYAVQIRERHPTARGVINLGQEQWQHCADALAGFRAEPQSVQQANDAIDAICTFLAGPITAEAPVDPRIPALQAALRRAQLGQLNVGWLAGELSISESRLSHLFKREMGIPLQRYLLWYKLAQAALSVGRGLTLTDAAEALGFADVAHFSRAFRATFGITPSQAFRGSRAHIVSDLHPSVGLPQ